MANPAAVAPQGIMGQPVRRYDARAKVTGTATYAADFTLPHTAYAYLLGSRIARGSIRSLDLGAAKSLPGVLDILTYENAAHEIKPMPAVAKGGYLSDSVVPLGSATIAYAGQPIAMVLAESYEAARDAAHRIVVAYDQAESASSFTSPDAVFQPLATQNPKHEDPAVGDFATAYAAAPVRVDSRYSTPTQHHNAIELFATQCVWNGSRLTVYEPSQYVNNIQHGLAAQLGIDPEQIRVVSPFVGGGFGAKGFMTPRTALVAVAARRLGRPVKLVASREQGFTLSTYRAETRQRVQLAAGRDGRLQALNHEGWEVTSRADPLGLAGTSMTTRLYACPNVASNVTLVRVDRSTPGFMRAPGEMPYAYALECAMDELAEALGIDPVELRRVNDTMKEPIKGLAYTSRSLMPCFDRAAEAFGWAARDKRPGSMRDGDWLVGWGCASSYYPTLMGAAAARVRLSANGHADVMTAGHELGQGLYTVVAQTAAERLGIPLDHVTVVMGDSDLPPGTIVGGSCGTASTCTAVARACDAIRQRLGTGDAPAADVLQAVRDRGVGAVEEYAETLAHGLPPGSLRALYTGQASPVGGAELSDRIQAAFGAQFAEVRVHSRTHEIRVPRVVGAFAAGRIVNPRTARSQLMGGMIWGIGSALHEQTELDPRATSYVNANLADYMVPVNADVGDVRVIMVPEVDELVNPLGVKGLGEIGIVGMAAAVANAVYHATGQRLRDLPLRIEGLSARA